MLRKAERRDQEHCFVIASDSSRVGWMDSGAQERRRRERWVVVGYPWETQWGRTEVSRCQEHRGSNGRRGKWKQIVRAKTCFQCLTTSEWAPFLVEYQGLEEGAVPVYVLVEREEGHRLWGWPKASSAVSQKSEETQSSTASRCAGPRVWVRG